IISCSDKIFGALLIRFFGKSLHPKFVVTKLLSDFDIAVSSLSPRGRYAHHYSVFSRGRELDSLSNHLLEFFFVANDMVGGEHAYDCGRIDSRNDEGRQPDRGSGVAGDRLRDDLLLRDALELPADGFDDVLIGNDPEAIFRGQRQEAQYGLLNHSLLAIEGEHLLGHAAAAARPESCAATTRQDHWIEGIFQFHQSQ